jgi:hypothetical protein
VPELNDITPEWLQNHIEGITQQCRSDCEREIKLGDRICVLLRQNARLNKELADSNHQLADAQQRIGDLLHEVEHHKWTADHATELLEKERKELGDGNAGK